MELHYHKGNVHLHIAVVLYCDHRIYSKLAIFSVHSLIHCPNNNNNNNNNTSSNNNNNNSSSNNNNNSSSNNNNNNSSSNNNNNIAFQTLPNIRSVFFAMGWPFAQNEVASYQFVGPCIAKSQGPGNGGTVTIMEVIELPALSSHKLKMCCDLIWVPWNITAVSIFFFKWTFRIPGGWCGPKWDFNRQPPCPQNEQFACILTFWGRG